MDKPPAKPWLIASHNAGKIGEFRALLAPLGIVVEGAADHGLPEPEETGATFAANAILKARAAAMALGRTALADDSGFCVEAMSGRPGLHSAPFMKERGREGAFAEIRRAVETCGKDGASFVCEIALCEPDGACQTFRGIVEGTVVFPPRGENGFGYDPIFVPRGESQTFAEMDPAQKQAMSHRGRALVKLLAAVAR